MAHDDLASEVDAFLTETGMAPSSFGRQAVNDWRLVDQLKAGREPRRSTANAIRTFMTNYRLAARSAEEVA